MRFASSRHTARFFNDVDCLFFGISIDPTDRSERRLVPQRPGIRFVLDTDHSISRSYGALEGDGAAVSYRPHWLLLDEMFRVVAIATLDQGEAIVSRLRDHLAQGWCPPAPVLVVPRIFEPQLCQQLIELYERNGGEASGVMEDVDGKTVRRLDDSYKRRTDCPIEDATLQQALGARITRFLAPVIRQTFQFSVTHLERFIVACYDDSEGGGHFRPHRDDTTIGTAHRRFACTINLNSEDYEGGDLRFPEFGGRTYRAPTGGAIIFSCSILHEVLPVTRGRRFAFLPFLHDAEAQVIREKNVSAIVDPYATVEPAVAHLKGKVS